MDVAKLHPYERGEEVASIVKDILGGGRSNCPVPLVTRDGHLITVETKVTFGTCNDEPALFGISRDITERLELESREQEIVKAESLGRMAGAVGAECPSLTLKHPIPVGHHPHFFKENVENPKSLHQKYSSLPSYEPPGYLKTVP